MMSSSEQSFSAVFAVSSGQDDNIGDIVLRRRFLDALRPLGPINVLLGENSPGFVEGLMLGASDVVYTGLEDWRAALDVASRRGRVLVADNPGEVDLTPGLVKQQILLMPNLFGVRRRKGRVVRFGTGIRSPHSGVWGLIYNLAFRTTLMFHEPVRWRDPISRDTFGIGSVMPDWGFADIGPERVAMTANDARNLFVISQRVDRPLPSAEWIDGVKMFCAAAGLKPYVVTQVVRDQPRSDWLADALGADQLPWDGQNPRRHENNLREIYRQTALVLSDRLHVLIVAMTEGAPPLCISEHSESKIGRHMDAVNYADVSIQVSGLSSVEIAALCHNNVNRGAELEAAVKRARKEIESVDRLLLDL
ncbi:polysaccharide pyruvyl transferase family protein [Brevundimonas sp. SL130]|uniref:polysaccharide pyruvyl transferase family protein n=1 Tax=Brevundimonas sp. SL130 TaxID=2995143 RepID=UPI00226C9B7F|nr:polysaccharide pyruvyl transferase family protein [Brevundimonas sp. SL130]WAC59872.1 hypothetical protein OU998_00045 [Brevundimonas sp. SL130]